MSSDMFSSLIEKEINQIENVFSFRELEYRQWEMFSEKCLNRNYNLCVIRDCLCKKEKCASWQLIEFIKFGKL